MAEFFKPYDGAAPYYFISYSHRDSEFVLDTISRLRQKKYRIWYDEGIPAGSDWPQNIQQHMEGCGAVLFFQSKTALASANCYNEIKTAHDLGKTVYCIRLDDAQPPELWAEAMENAGSVRSEIRPEILAEEIPVQCGAEIFLGTEEDYAQHRVSRGRRSFWDLLLAVLALLVVAACAMGFWQKQSSAAEAEPETRIIRRQKVEQAPEIDLGLWQEILRSHILFPDDEQENAVRDQLGNYDDQIPAEQLVQIRQLSFCGSKAMKNGMANVSWENGKWTVSSIPVPLGKVADLTLIGQMPYLETLDLVYQPVQDLSALKDLIALRQLNLAGCEYVDIATLLPMQSLETLSLEHSGIRDLTALSGQPALAAVTVSADMFPMTLDPEARYDVILVP